MHLPESPTDSRKIVLEGTGKIPRTVQFRKSVTSLVIRAKSRSRTLLFIELLANGHGVRHQAEFVLEPESSLEVIFLWWGRDASHIVQRAMVAKDACLHLLNVTLGAAEHSLVSEVMGEHGTSTLDWIAHASGKERCSLSVRNVFRAREGKGEVTVHGVAEEQAHIRCDGTIEIGPKGRKTETHLTERILLLSPTAEADAAPKLTIEVDDVKAGHSAAVSRIAPEDLFYLRSRGLSEKIARGMYVEGFLSDLTQRIPEGKIRSFVQEALRNG